MDNKDLEKYLIEIGKTPFLSIEEEIELAKAVQQKGADCDEMKKLTKHNELLVLSVARQYQNKGLSLEELLKAGREGLAKAALKYDASRGFSFIAFAVWWIRREIVLSLLLLPCGGFAERFLLPLGALMSMSSIPLKTLQFFKNSVIMEVRVQP